MRRVAADLRIVSLDNHRIADLERQFAEACEAGDLVRAVQLRKELQRVADDVAGRVRLASRTWEAIGALDPDAWAAARQAAERDSGHPLFDMLVEIGNKTNASIVGELTAEQCREAIASHGKACRDPRCAIVPMLQARLRALGEQPS
jgi:hypothetical protein